MGRVMMMVPDVDQNVHGTPKLIVGWWSVKAEGLSRLDIAPSRRFCEAPSCVESSGSDVMAITSDMAKMTVRSTFALDPETVEALDRLASRWGASKSEVLRRVIGIASKVEDVDAASDALAALDELQGFLGLDEAQADEWVARIRAERSEGP
jgi:predicted DNA-binding protein